MNLKNLKITKERLEYSIRSNLEQQRKLQNEQGLLEEFYAMIMQKISLKMQEGEE